MKVWITQYALTSGILEVEGKVSERFPTLLDITKGANGKKPEVQWTIHKPHWHTTREAAVDAAILLAKKKLKSISKSADTIRGLQAEWEKEANQR